MVIEKNSNWSKSRFAPCKGKGKGRQGQGRVLLLRVTKA